MAIDKGVVALNSTYVEYVDRFFLLRGWGVLCGIPGIVVALVAAIVISLAIGGMNRAEYPAEMQGNIALLVVGGLFALVATALLRITMFRDIFGYTYSPIRFNRVERKIYVFNGDLKGGILTIPWDKAFLFPGRGRPIGGGDADWTYDLRCHVLDENEVVRHTFAIGHHCGNSKTEVLQHWEMIRRYMEEGPQALPFPPLALYLSTEPTLRNAFIIQVGGMGDGWLRVVAGIFTVPWAIARYLTLKTCRRPKWTEEIERACRIEPNDPYLQPTPRFAGDGQTKGPDGDTRYFAYQEKAAEEAIRYDQAHEKSSDIAV
ncbi:DUF6708 domain-containing protein [Novilysobacter arseniciresistens]|uniref:DUF6708 domain-containing protein n=1 Tax=Novilysobacter arseniciresistens TaxID=1385522 RepID=UPI00126A24CE|nr:DUF6708 domain-containing protein [Lysobacter arseniciresistens]